MLSLVGLQGSAKSTLTEVIVELVHPVKSGLRPPPRTDDDFYIAASKTRLLALENVSFVGDRLSDAICRVSTGAGYGKRRLYTDDDEVLLETCCPVVINGIPDVVIRGDLADRALVLNLPDLGEFREEDDFWGEFREQQPKLMGAIFEALGGVLARRDGIQLEHPPRMADFARWGVAAERALGWPDGSFLAAYETNQRDVRLGLVEQDEVAQAVIRFLETHPGAVWTGKANELLRELRHASYLSAHEGALPKSPRALAGRLRRLVPVLREVGIDIRWNNVGHHQRDVVITRRVEGQEEALVHAAADGPR